MPFTLSHPAAVLPLRRFSRLPLAALITGSVTPDLGYYFTPADYFRESAHTFARTFTFCLPLGLLLLLALYFLRAGLARLLPKGAATILEVLFSRPLFGKALPFTALSLLIGAWSHLLWDGWTHRQGIFVEALPFLQIETIYGFELFRVLQHLSTLSGAALLYLYIARESARLGSPLVWRWNGKWAFWLVTAALSLAFTSLTLRADWNYALGANDRRLGFLFIVSWVRNASVLLAIAAAAMTWKKQSP